MVWINYFNEYVDLLYFGYFGGFLIKLIWFVFGVGLIMFFVMGVMMIWKCMKFFVLIKI